MMNVELSPSMMCANFANLEMEVKMLEESGIDSFHIDVMDGQFVDNFGMGYQDTKFICGATRLPVEAHLMINNPRYYLHILFDLGLEVIYIHPESDKDPATTLEAIRIKGIEAGIAINPGTSIENVYELLNIAKRVMVLGVNPGHAGRDFAPYVGDKTERLLALREKFGFEVYWDGAATKERILQYSKLGVKGFVLGTAVLFDKEGSYADIVRDLKNDLSNSIRQK